MGSVCCCFHVEDEEYTHPNNSIYSHCLCLRCLTTQLLHAYTVLFQRAEVRSISSSGQGTAASSGLVDDSSISDTYRPPPRPLPYDDPRCSRLQRGLVSRRDKGSSHAHEESEPLRRSNNGADIESMAMTNKWNESDHGGLKVCHSESSLKQSFGEVISGVTYSTSSEDEDVCPTCLEEYTLENPRITMQCSHHFHLGCIYEWMERSEACPICGKVMVFNETI